MHEDIFRKVEDILFRPQYVDSSMQSDAYMRH